VVRKALLGEGGSHLFIIECEILKSLRLGVKQYLEETIILVRIVEYGVLRG